LGYLYEKYRFITAFKNDISTVGLVGLWLLQNNVAVPENNISEELLKEEL
jgi:hypothetical protein